MDAKPFPDSPQGRLRDANMALYSCKDQGVPPPSHFVQEIHERAVFKAAEFHFIDERALRQFLPDGFDDGQAGDFCKAEKQDDVARDPLRLEDHRH